MEKLISIIIPVYNVCNYIEQCLDSVCNQTYKNLEIIIVDDGSTDGSTEIIEKHSQADQRIILIKQENKGVSAARNIGLEIAKGSYIMFVDGDDWIEPETCETSLRSLLENDVDVVLWAYIREYPSIQKPSYTLGNEIKVYDKKTIIDLYRQMIGIAGEQLKHPHLADSCITVWGKLYRRDLIGKIKFVDIKKIGTEDTFFNIQVFSQAATALYLPKTFSHYRKTNDSSITHGYKRELVTQWQELYGMIEEHINVMKNEVEMQEAFNNRKCLMLIGLGLSLVSDKSMSFLVQSKELRDVLNMPLYKNALKAFSCYYLPFHWKIFYVFMKNRMVIGSLLMLKAMDYLRRR